MASESVLKYLKDTNRPYSCADVTVNLRGAFSKSVVQKTLDALSDSGQIRCKLYGKQKVYVAIQVDKAEDNDCDIEDFDNLMKSLTETLTQNSAQLKAVETNLKALMSAPTTTDAAKLTEEKKCIIDTLETKLNSLKSSSNVVCVEDRKVILEEHGKFVKEYKKRKRICSDMLEAVLEGYPKPKKVLLEELCLETDEMVDFKLISS